MDGDKLTLDEILLWKVDKYSARYKHWSKKIPVVEPKFSYDRGTGYDDCLP